jgi:tetratricopeptide (TPR) repeat protein
MSDLLLLLRTAETTDEAKNIDSLINDIQSAHDSSIVSKAMRLANLNIIRGKSTEALSILNKVALLDPRFSYALTLLSALHHNRREYKDSVMWAQFAIKRDPSQYNAYRPLAVSQEHLVGGK